MEMNESRLSYFTPEDKPYGLTYGQWTVKWWQWFASIPADKHPALDTTGELASIHQPYKEVWFLAGTLGGETVSSGAHSDQVDYYFYIKENP